MLYGDGLHMPHVHPRVQVTYLEEKGAKMALGTFSALVIIPLMYTVNYKEWKWMISEFRHPLKWAERCE